MQDLRKMSNEELVNLAYGFGAFSSETIRAELLRRLAPSEGMKPRCPKCGSDALEFWVEEIGETVKVTCARNPHEFLIQHVDDFRQFFALSPARSGELPCDHGCHKHPVALHQLRDGLMRCNQCEEELQQKGLASMDKLQKQGELLESLAPHLKDCEGGCPYCHDLLDKYDATRAAPPSLEECAKKMAEAYGWGWEHMSDAAKLTFTKMAKAALDTLQAYFAGAVGQPEWDELSAILDAAGVPDKEPGVLPGEEVFLSLETRVKWLTERGASSSRSGEPLRRCSFFTPQFGQCVYDEGHKEGHLYAEPAEG